MQEKRDGLRPAMGMIRVAVEREVPVLGICLGAQLLARSLGACVRRSPANELGFVSVRRTPATASDLLLGEVGEDEMFFEWHEDTFDRPTGATLLLAGDVVENQAFRVGQRAWGLQFHAEVTRPKLEAWFDLSAEQIHGWGSSPDRLWPEVEAHLGAQQARFREMFTRFVALLGEPVAARPV
jgi:GMP synthase (glutamine-hydrolysing)